MELRDVFLKDGTFTGRTIEKHTPMQKGWYLWHAVVIMKTMDGQYVMQQRSLKAKYSPGEWDVTGGGVISGETSAQAAIREAKEEVGVTVKPENLRHMLREVHYWGEDYGMICDTYAARVELHGEGLVFSEYEVNDVKCVSFREFFDTVIYNKSEAFCEMLKRVEAEI